MPKNRPQVLGLSTIELRKACLATYLQDGVSLAEAAAKNGVDAGLVYGWSTNENWPEIRRELIHEAQQAVAHRCRGIILKKQAQILESLLKTGDLIDGQLKRLLTTNKGSLKRMSAKAVMQVAAAYKSAATIAAGLARLTEPTAVKNMTINYDLKPRSAPLRVEQEVAIEIPEEPSTPDPSSIPTDSAAGGPCIGS